MENSIYHSKSVYNCLKQLNLCRVFPHIVIKHILAVLLAVFSRGYKGKTVNFQDYSPCHRTTIAHFLNKGSWDSARLEDILKDRDIIKAFLKRGFYTAGALRTNRTLYPCGIKCSIRESALHIRKTDRDVSLVTVGSRGYYVYRYEGKLNGVEDAAVLISYPAEAFHNPKAFRAFICTDTSLSTQEILDTYTERCPIEVYFHQAKNILAFDKYQICSAKGICRYWLLIPLAHFICCTTEQKGVPFGKFERGYAFFCQKIQEEGITYFYRCGASHRPLEEVLALAE